MEDKEAPLPSKAALKPQVGGASFPEPGLELFRRCRPAVCRCVFTYWVLCAAVERAARVSGPSAGSKSQLCLYLMGDSE